jgi:hypothetical protein
MGLKAMDPASHGLNPRKELAEEKMQRFHGLLKYMSDF